MQNLSFGYDASLSWQTKPVITLVLLIVKSLPLNRESDIFCLKAVMAKL